MPCAERTGSTSRSCPAFGAESVVLLHMAGGGGPVRAGPVHRQRNAVHRNAGVSAVEVTRTAWPDAGSGSSAPANRTSRRQDPDGTLHQREHGSLLCDLRKTRAACRMRAGGVRRLDHRAQAFPGGYAVQALEFFELEEDTNRIKVNPLAHWTPDRRPKAYMDENRLPRHPLVARGLPVDWLRALHLSGEGRRRPARRSLAQ